MLGGVKKVSQTSQEHWTKVQKQSFAAGLGIFKCAWIMEPVQAGGQLCKTSADFGWKWTLGC